MRRFAPLFMVLLVCLIAASFVPAEWKKVNSKLYSFEVPVAMSPTADLNDEASSQYSYVKKEGSEVLELYVLVIQETHKEIKSYEGNTKYTTRSYWDIVSTTLRESLTDFRILNGEAALQNINGLECIQSDMYGKMDGGIEIFYRLAVFQGKKGFYQVLTWTVNEQKDRFFDQMTHMLMSFKENK